MALNLVDLPAAYFPNPRIARPIFNGQIFIGEVGTDPEVPANQKQVFISDSGIDDTPVETTQPIAIGAGGVPEFNGSPVTVFVDGSYSMKVLDNRGRQAYYFSDVTNGTPLTAESVGALTNYTFNNISDLSNLTTSGGVVLTSIENREVGYVSEQNRDGHFVFFENDLSLEVTEDPQQGIYVAPSFDPSGLSGAWVRVVGNYITPEYFGAVADGVTDDTTAFQAAVDKSPLFGTVFLKKSAYLLSQSITLSQGASVEGSGNDEEDTEIIMSVDLPAFTEGDSTDEFYSLVNFRITGVPNVGGDPYAVVNPLIDINTTPSGVNSYHTLTNLFMKFGGGGMRLAGKGMSIVENNRAQFCRGIGYELLGPDGYYDNCHAINSWGDGFVVAGANNRFIACHSTFSGEDEGDSSRVGYYVTGPRNTFDGCHAQNNAGDGFFFDGCFAVVCDASLADNNGQLIANGGVGYKFRNANGMIVNGVVENFAATDTQEWAIEVTGTFARNYITIRGNNQISGVADVRPISYTESCIDVVLDNDQLRMTQDYQILSAEIDATESDFAETIKSRKQGDSFSRVAVLAGGRVRFSDGASAADAGLYRPSAGVVGPETTTILQCIGASDFNFPFRVGTISLWQNGGNLYARNGLPANATDGTILL